jgi:hypothetical protein
MTAKRASAEPQSGTSVLDDPESEQPPFDPPPYGVVPVPELPAPLDDAPEPLIVAPLLVPLEAAPELLAPTPLLATPPLPDEPLAIPLPASSFVGPIDESLAPSLVPESSPPAETPASTGLVAMPVAPQKTRYCPSAGFAILIPVSGLVGVGVSMTPVIWCPALSPSWLVADHLCIEMSEK